MVKRKRGRPKKESLNLDVKKIWVITEDKKEKIQELTDKIKLIEKNYWITQTKLLPHQQEMFDWAADTYRAWIRWVYKTLPRYKYVVMQWGNWVWKSFTLYYLTALYAIWRQVKNYKLPYLWTKKNIIIVTQSSSNVRDYVEPYLLWDNSPCRIPPDLVEKVIKWPDSVKWIELTNWCKITIKTVEQGQKRLVWANPDLLVIDEPIEKDEVWNELLARLRAPEAQLLYWFTPINWYNASYYFLYEQHSEKVKEKIFHRVYTSTENIYQDHSTLEWMTEKERKMRLYWEFTPLTWLVYNEFSRYNSTVEHFHPKDLWPCRYYAWLDFWTSHPFWFVAIAVDSDWHHYIFDSSTWSDILLKDIAERIKSIKKKYWIDFEYIVADTAWKRERLELKQYWINTTPADKWWKWANWESNRRAWIMKVNQLLHDKKLFVADNNIELIKEFSTHCYKDWSRDWEVIKENDDLLDAMRYAIWSIKTPKISDSSIDAFKDKYWISYYDYKNNNDDEYRSY